MAREHAGSLRRAAGASRRSPGSRSVDNERN
jgi:hypothetical protein